MSAPVLQEKKLAAPAEVDLSVHMEHIDLQNDQIKMPESERNDRSLQTTAPKLGAGACTRSSLESKKMSRSIRLSSLRDACQPPEATDDLQGYSNTSIEQKPTQDRTSEWGNSFQGHDPFVGRGTLYFNTETLGSAAPAATQSVGSDKSRPVSCEDRRLLPGAYDPMENRSLRYGSGPLWSPSSLPSNPDQKPNLNQQNGQSCRQPFKYKYPGSRVEKAPYATTKQHGNSEQEHTSNRTMLDAFRMCWSYLWKFLCAFFCCSSSDVEQLQRAFCYGAIDGMLTGSGIVAAFCGMDLLAPTSTITIRAFVVVFSAAACFADSLCMALGHVWTTHVLVSTQARERAATRASVDKNKANAKGKLVDMLLERGMLKIDAMSLADTLEGYPDMFVSALVGDALIAGCVGGTTDSSTDWSAKHRSQSGGSPSASRASSFHHWNGNEDFAQHLADQETGGNGNFILWKFPSYGQHINDLDEEVGPEAAVVAAAMAESRREGLFMMIGFSLFAVVPSLIYLVCPMVGATKLHLMSSKYFGSGLNSDDDEAGGSTSATSIVIAAAAFCMWCLGVWKSRFLDSNWMLFGIETVFVMLVCIGAAYGVGSLLRACFPGLDALTSGAMTINM